MRTASKINKTDETCIKASINLDGGQVEISTCIGFFDHMLETFAKYANFGLVMKVSGDLGIDAHHTVEETGAMLGQLLSESIYSKDKIKGLSSSFVPMDESLSFSSVDINSMPYLVFNAEFPQDKVGDFDSCLAEEFMRAFAFNAGITLHIKSIYGRNSHHIIESIFKSVGCSLKDALVITKQNNKVKLLKEDA